MNKSIKILSIISLSFACFGILLAVSMLTFLWEPMAFMFSQSPEVMEAGPIVPVGNMLSIFGCTIVALVLLISYKSKRFIAIEILSIVFLSLIFPILAYFLGVTQNILVGNSYGTVYLATLAITNNVLMIPCSILRLSSALCLVISGMRIANKINYKKQDDYHDLLTHILLLLFTFGIWQYIWIYKTTAYLNITPNEEKRNPTTKLLLCMFVPFYYIYWTYKSAQRIDKLAISKGQQSDISTLCLILSIVIGIVPPIIMQDKINNIVKPKTIVNTTVNTDKTSANINSTTIGVTDELKKYKDLFDTGVITQEEFDAKKKQLLDL